MRSASTKDQRAPRRTWIWLVAAGCLLASWAGIQALARPVDSVSRAIQAQACRTGRDRFALADVAGADWDSVVILTPYADQQIADQAIGHHWLEFASHQSALEDEGTDVLVFMQQGRVIRAVEHPRSMGDFADNLSGSRFTRQQAVFAIGWDGGRCLLRRL